MKKRIKMLTAALCAVVLLCGFSVTAYAGGGPEWEGLDPAEETTTPEPTIVPGEGFTEEGSLVTRDLLYDEHTNKQFITVQTSGGSTFYIVIDYDKPTDEEGEQYETYFFSVVDEADLLAALEASGTELPECSCTEKCVAGAINMDCPVCSTNMTECVGYGLPGMLHQYDRVRGGGAGARTCGGAGAYPRTGARTGGWKHRDDPAHSGGGAGGRRSRVVFQGLPPQAAAGRGN